MRRIRFIPYNQYTLNNLKPPQPARQYLADWYRQGESAIFNDTLKRASLSDKNISGGMKSCIPFFDAMVSGYIMETWESVEVYENSNGILKWRYVEQNPYTDEWDEKNNVQQSMFEERHGDSGSTIPRPAGHAHNHMILQGKWGIRLPKGWSLLITHPINRWDLPFTVTSGIIDSDEWWTSGNIPFFLKEGWTGIIPAGTPFCQLVPIKRSSWASYTSILSTPRVQYLSDKVGGKSIGWYKKNVWIKKQYD
jgi:hypothetical protein